MSDVILHEAHVRALRLQKEAAWLADRSHAFRHHYLKRVKASKGKAQHDVLAELLDRYLLVKRECFGSKMDVVKKAVFHTDEFRGTTEKLIVERPVANALGGQFGETPSNGARPERVIGRAAAALGRLNEQATGSPKG